MQIIKAGLGEFVHIGWEREHHARQVQFDISPWLNTYGQGDVELLYQRPGDAAPYPVAVEREGTLVLWTITATDTAQPGRDGHAQLQYYVGETLVKSETCCIAVGDALGEPGEAPGTPGQAWLDQVREAVESVVNGTEQYVPDYVKAGADRAAQAILALRSEHTFTFASVADVHVNYGGAYAQQTKESIVHAAMAIKRVAAQVGVDFVVNFGDNLWGENTGVEDAEKENMIVNQAVFDAFRSHPNFRLVGNHDANLGDAVIPTAAVYAMNGWYNDFDAVGATKMRGYGYKDFQQYKLRVIALNTSDYIDNKGGFAMSDEQKLWFMQALDLSGKDDAKQWQILILSHFPLDYSDSDDNTCADVTAVLAAYQNGGAVSISAGTYDYQGKNKAHIIADIHGHIHNFSYGAMADHGIIRVCTPNTCFYNSGWAGVGAEESYLPNEVYHKTAGTQEDTTVTFYTVDLEKKIIYSTNYGAGYDREISYADTAPKEEAAFVQVVDDLVGAVRQALYITDGAIAPVSDNQKMILGCSTDNGHGWTTREGAAAYLIPVPEQAARVTVETTDTSWTQMGIALITVADGVYSSINPGWLDIGSYEFTAGSVDYVAINLLAETDVAWGYDASANITVTFT